MYTVFYYIVTVSMTLLQTRTTASLNKPFTKLSSLVLKGEHPRGRRSQKVVMRTAATLEEETHFRHSTRKRTGSWKFVRWWQD